MNNRYEILDILSQDASGICFHAEDRETGKEVALRRFFPFGPDGGGLQNEERMAYEIGVKRLQEIAHPALRTVLDGGTDPVDGMPFLVTEWIEGTMLSDRLQEGTLSSESVRSLADLALETSIILSEAFGEEAVWVETDPTSIILSESDPARQVTFWICPLRWLGDASSRSNLKPLLEMVESLSGWQGQMISRNSGGGLGAWARTLRDEPTIWTLEQAKSALHEPATIVEASAAKAQQVHTASPTATTPATPAPVQQVVFVNRPVIWPWVLAGTLALGAAGIIGWKHFNPRTPPTPTATTTSEPAGGPRADVELQPRPGPAVASSAQAPRSPGTKNPAAVPEESGLAAINRRAAELSQASSGRFLVGSGEKGSYTGVIKDADASGSDKTRYAQFEIDHEGDTHLLWAAFSAKNWPEHDLENLRSLIGRRVKLSGTWRNERSSRKQILTITDESGFELLEDN